MLGLSVVRRLLGVLRLLRLSVVRRLVGVLRVLRLREVGWWLPVLNWWLHRLLLGGELGELRWCGLAGGDDGRRWRGSAEGSRWRGCRGRLHWLGWLCRW